MHCSVCESLFSFVLFVCLRMLLSLQLTRVPSATEMMSTAALQEVRGWGGGGVRTSSVGRALA